jgi:DNA polymerase III delta prime subunit
MECTNNNTISWLEKYRPKSLSEYYMSKKQLDVVKEWIKDFRNQVEDSKPFLILHGTAGIGKTTLAYLILEYYNYEIIECNASDTRTKKTIHETLGQISKVSVCIDNNNNFKETAILMDEIDGLNGGEFSSVQELIDIITKDKDTKTKKNICPVICTCNSIKNKKLQILMKYSVVLQINKPSNNDCSKLINRISTLENFDVPETIKNDIIEKSFGDYRQIIMLLYVYYNDIIITNTTTTTTKETHLELQEYINNSTATGATVTGATATTTHNNVSLNYNEDDPEHFINIKKINHSCETPLEKINYILTNATKLEDIETICSEDANIYYMNLYINIIPIIYELQNKKMNTSKDSLLLYYKKIYTLYELLKNADLLNNKIFIDKQWELLDYFQCIGIAIPLQILHAMNLKSSNKYLIPRFNIQHHSQYNFMRQEQSLIRKKINTDYTLSFESDIFSIYYYIKRFKHINKLEIENVLNNKKKKNKIIDCNNQKYLINRLYDKIIEKIDDLLA